MCQYLRDMSVMYVNQGPGLALAVASNVRARAARLGMNSSRLARALGMSVSTVNERWRGERPWQLAEIEKLASVLGIEPGQLLEYTTRDSNPEPAGLESGAVVIDLASWRMAS